MKQSLSSEERMANLTFAKVYPLYVEKVKRKGRSEEELLAVIEWLTSYNNKEIQKWISTNSTFKAFFENAKLPANAHKITGLICGLRVEEIENPLTQKIRYLDKLVDELAKGKSLDKIMR